jgi:hypothetical protein
MWSVKRSNQKKNRRMNPMGYTRLGESEIRLFQIPVQDIVDFPLVAGTYRYIESVIVVHGAAIVLWMS